MTKIASWTDGIPLFHAVLEHRLLFFESKKLNYEENERMNKNKQNRILYYGHFPGKRKSNAIL